MIYHPQARKFWEELVWAVLALTVSRVLMAGAAQNCGERNTGSAEQELAREAGIAGDGPAALSLQFLYVTMGLSMWANLTFLTSIKCEGR